MSSEGLVKSSLFEVHFKKQCYDSLQHLENKNYCTLGML